MSQSLPRCPRIVVAVEALQPSSPSWPAFIAALRNAAASFAVVSDSALCEKLLRDYLAENSPPRLVWFVDEESAI